MNTIRARLAALASRGVAEVTPELAGTVELWVDRIFELLLLLGYAVVHPWPQKRWNPTGAFTGEAARKSWKPGPPP